MISDIAEQKRDLRRRAMARRAMAASGPGHAERAAEALAVQGVRHLAGMQGRIVSGFWPMRDEIDPRPLMIALHEAGYGLALPVVVAKGRPLVFRVWTPGTVLVPGVFGTEMPGHDAPECVPDILLVPLLAFGRDGTRLGYGGGFYDMTLEALRMTRHVTALGIAYAAQEMQGIPTESWDQRLDGVLTEAGVIGSGR